jgi:hypothetical protein
MSASSERSGQRTRQMEAKSSRNVNGMLTNLFYGQFQGADVRRVDRR